MDTELGQNLRESLSGTYNLEREIVGAGMSRVFVAEDRALGRRVVIKVLPPEMAASVRLERFRREIQFAASLIHPHIIPLLTAGETLGLPYYTTPFVESRAMDWLIKGIGRTRRVHADDQPRPGLDVVRSSPRFRELASKIGPTQRLMESDSLAAHP